VKGRQLVRSFHIVNPKGVAGGLDSPFIDATVHGDHEEAVSFVTEFEGPFSTVAYGRGVWRVRDRRSGEYVDVVVVEMKR
jgi:hypothetical protein